MRLRLAVCTNLHKWTLVCWLYFYMCLGLLLNWDFMVERDLKWQYSALCVSIIVYEVWAHLLWKLRKCKRCSTLSDKQNKYSMRMCTLGSAFPESCNYWQVASALSWMQPNSWEMIVLFLTQKTVTSPVGVDNYKVWSATFWFRNK